MVFPPCIQLGEEEEGKEGAERKIQKCVEVRVSVVQPEVFAGLSLSPFPPLTLTPPSSLLPPPSSLLPPPSSLLLIPPLLPPPYPSLLLFSSPFLSSLLLFPLTFSSLLLSPHLSSCPLPPLLPFSPSPCTKCSYSGCLYLCWPTNDTDLRSLRHPCP